jgi:hypothetical protein
MGSILLDNPLALSESSTRCVHLLSFPRLPHILFSYTISLRIMWAIQAQEQSLQVVYPQEYRRSLPLKGLHQRALPYQEYLALMQCEASTQQRLLALGRWKVRSD